MILPVYIYGSAVLREKTAEVTPETPNLQTLIDNMYETMYNADGIGIAAPQIGKALRLFVIDADPLAEEYPECAGFKKAFLNARITRRLDDAVSLSEGCLSIPGINEKVSRPTEIEITYMDREFVEHTETYTGFAARVIQHEYDHIEGILFTDLISPMRKRMIKSKLKKMSEGNYSAHYDTARR